MGFNLKERIDQLLVDRGLAKSKECAEGLVMSGLVIVDGKKATKAGGMVSKTAVINLMKSENPYVSRGGLKLEAALDAFSINPDGMTAMDVGASTGGFTDCLLQKGTKKVYAIDVGYGQLAWRLRKDPRVVVLERRNIRKIKKEDGDIEEGIDLATVDLSFISLKKAIPKIMEFVREGGAILALIKPQFEARKEEVSRGGIVREEDKREKVVADIVTFAGDLGLFVVGVIPSPILGRKGNREYFIYLKKQGEDI